MKKQDFLNNTVSGEFGFAMNLTGSVNKDGTVDYNEEGLRLFTFNTIADFVAHHFDDKPANYDVCEYIGERDDNGKVTFFDGHSMETDGIDDEDDDGEAVHSAPVTYSDQKETYIALLEVADSPDSVAPFVFQSHRVFKTADKALCRDKLFLVEALNMKSQFEAYELDIDTSKLGVDFYIEIHTPVNAKVLDI